MPLHYVHDDVIKWKHFPRNWPFVRGIHRSPVNSPHKGQWRGALMFSLIYVWINDWVNNRKAGDLRRYCAHYDVIVMICVCRIVVSWCSLTQLQGNLAISTPQTAELIKVTSARLGPVRNNTRLSSLKKICVKCRNWSWSMLVKWTPTVDRSCIHIVFT